MVKKSILALIVIVVICAIAAVSWFATHPYSANNTTNISNNTNNPNITSNLTANNTTVSPDDQNGNNNPPPSRVSADEAKDLAKKYVGPDVTLGKPVMTTYKGVHAWQVPVYTMNHKFINNIYIDERNGQKVN